MRDKDNSILFLGDVVPWKAFKFKNSYKTIINLECPITAEGQPAKNKINLRVENNYLKDIFGNNLICVSLGNNHIFDFGEEGLESTLNALRKIDVKWFGIDTDAEKNLEPLIINFNNLRIAFFSAVCQSTSPVVELENKIHLSTLDADLIIKKVKEIRNSADRIVLYLHWGTEESSYPSEENIQIARNLIDAGADIIAGSHAHCPQPVERYKEGIIAYNLGNFLMPSMKDIPAYFDETHPSGSTYFKNLMIWNRISWGLLVDMKTRRYKIKKYIFLFNRIMSLPFTPLDRYTGLIYDNNKEKYEQVVSKHRRKRAFFRRIRYFISKPHIPGRIKNYL